MYKTIMLLVTPYPKITSFLYNPKDSWDHGLLTRKSWLVEMTVGVPKIWRPPTSQLYPLLKPNPQTLGRQYIVAVLLPILSVGPIVPFFLHRSNEISPGDANTFLEDAAQEHKSE